VLLVCDQIFGQKPCRLSKLFDELGVDTIQSDMSLSIAARGVSGVEDSWKMRDRGFEGKVGEEAGRRSSSQLRDVGGIRQVHSAD
jgi:hypothetical protein